MIDDEILERLVKREGGYVNRPEDKGGPTRWGITIPTLRRWRRQIRGCVPDGEAHAHEAIRNLSRAEAKAIYRELFLKRHNLRLVHSPELREHMLDCVVLHGSAAARWLQKAAGVKADGIIGPVTIKHVNRIDWAVLTVEVYKARARAIARTVVRDPTQLVFLRGWVARTLEFI
jgi:lysozyme family protein